MAERRALAMEKKFESHKQKEKLESAALEKMIRDVEKNLKETTERAILAEGNSNRLQLELNKALMELEATRGSKGTPGSGFGPYSQDNMLDIHTRVNQVSQDLHIISENAKNAIQMLLTNAQSLEGCSFALRNLDKLTELKSK